MITYKTDKGNISTYEHECEREYIILSEKYITKIVKINGLNNFVNLVGLYLNSNRITEIKELDGLVNLITLDLSRNKITNTRGFATSCTNLYISLYLTSFIH
jgi:Leucine-rich repeat (LRR) protein